MSFVCCLQLVGVAQLDGALESYGVGKVFASDTGKRRCVVSVFRKKRMSLNRAVEIRSYLLGKGYKNFSIKVINVNEADKNNLVTVVELK